MKEELVEWTCPYCQTINEDVKFQTTHCAGCGEVVYVLDEDENFDDYHYKIKL
jgi:hypothetical protein